MRKLTLLLSGLLLACFLHADPLLDINAQLKQPDFLTAEFEQKKFLKILKTPLLSNGNFWISKSQGIIWQVEKPVFTQVILSKTGIHFSDQQSSQTNKSMEYVGKLLQGLLNGNMQALEEQFTILITTPIQEHNDWVIELTPKSLLLRKGIESITLSGNNYISHITLHEATGDKTVIDFMHPQALDALPTELQHAF